MKGLSNARHEINGSERCSTFFTQPGTCHLALGPGNYCLDGSATGGTHKADLSDQPYLPAHSEPSPMDWSPGRVSGLLAGDDCRYDATIKHASCLYDGPCKPTSTASVGDSGSFFGGVCSYLDRLRTYGVHGRYVSALAGQQLVL